VPFALNELKSRWNEILDCVERNNRVAWLAYFDGRLVSLDAGILTIDFSDPAKLSGAHDYTTSRSASLREILEKAILEVTGEKISVVEK
jgi:hypothetical protein